MFVLENSLILFITTRAQCLLYNVKLTHFRKQNNHKTYSKLMLNKKRDCLCNHLIENKIPGKYVKDGGGNSLRHFISLSSEMIEGNLVCVFKRKLCCPLDRFFIFSHNLNFFF